jgi:protein-S-isoprenylcysteine O-methyltransferase Ste14
MLPLELKIPPLALTLIFALAIVAFGYLAPSANAPFPGHRGVAVAFLLVGIAVAVAAVVQFRQAKTSVNPMLPDRASAIVATGVFRLSRNPMYVGMALVLLGLCAWWSTLPGFALVPLFCLYMTEFQIKPEEGALLSRFGPEFGTYMARVRRWL